MSFGGVTGWLGCNLAGLGDIVNCVQCISCWGNELNLLIFPVFEKMGEMLGLGAEGIGK
jgi:hypothetical protein